VRVDTHLRFYYDVWCRSHSLKELYPHLYVGKVKSEPFDFTDTFKIED